MREVLDKAGVLGSRATTASHPEERVLVARDLVDLVVAAEWFGVGRDTIRRWVTVEGLPYRDALGRVTWSRCSFALVLVLGGGDRAVARAPGSIRAGCSA